MGLDLSTAINLFLKQSIRENRIPFTISRETPNDETVKAIENGRNGVGLSKPFHSVAELMEDLNADDPV